MNSFAKLMELFDLSFYVEETAVNSSHEIVSRVKFGHLVA